ncbi:alpha/beta hydrolase [Sphingobium sp. CAP-1]|uniref:alpha/beta hydrolase n=1 Tax=Sphingobium sp. CAP-1 TaxID=2676077 RepID=UPI0012BB2EB0|nr:alpha/beta hydrolase [Sphingobium sp. CAP-1]QGP80653.1 alpha/beta hydrolase fold domain-containing protein [Sphingobium sp. CAP-1]
MAKRAGSISIGAAILFATCGLGNSAMAQIAALATGPEPALGDPMPERIVTLGHGVTVSTDIPFSTIPGYRPITLDLYRPAKAGQSLPLIIYVHGGGWMAGHTRQSGAFSDFTAVLADLSARGYVVASLEYRLSGEAPFPAAIDDVRSAIRFLKANAGRYGIDAGHVAIWGGSAGGQLSALAALDCGHEPTGADKNNAGQSDCVQAAVGWYGVYDFATMPQSAIPRAENQYLDCVKATCPADRIAAASPAAHVDAKDPPMLLIHGTDDQTVPVTQSRELAAKLEAAKVPVTLEIIPKVGHSWIGVDAAATRAASLHALDLTFRFFDAQLKGGR